MRRVLDVVSSPAFWCMVFAGGSVLATTSVASADPVPVTSSASTNTKYAVQIAGSHPAPLVGPSTVVLSNNGQQPSTLSPQAAAAWDASSYNRNAITPAPSGVAPATVPLYYGMSGTNCVTYVSSSYWDFCQGQSAQWTALKSHLGVHFARIVVPWDTVDTWNSTSGCVYNETSGGVFNETYGGVAYASSLLDWLQAVSHEGLQPVITLGTGNGVGTAGGSQEPYWPNANSANGLINPGDTQYECGFEGLVNWVKAWSLPVSYWETYNEPDDYQPPSNNASIPYSVAGNYEIDAYSADHRSLGRSDVILAGGFNYNSLEVACCGYLQNFLTKVRQSSAADGFNPPDGISGHPYTDPTRSAYLHGDTFLGTSRLVNYTNGYLASGIPIWLTETGVWLADPETDSHGHSLGYDVANYPAGNPTDLAYGGQDIEDTHANYAQVEGVFLFEFETYGDGVSTGTDTFDSALMGISNTDWTQSGLYNPAASEYGVARADLCVLAYGDTVATAIADARCDTPTTPQNPISDWEDPTRPAS